MAGKVFEIRYLSETGEGIAEKRGKSIKIAFAYPGEVVVARFYRGRARATKILKASPDRVEAPCSVFGVCGSCRWQGLKYEAQLRYKAEIIKKLFGVEKRPIPSPKIWFYRNRMDYAVTPYGIGMRRFGSYYRVASFRRCLLQSEESNEIVRRSTIFFRNEHLQPYDIRKARGFIRYLVVREGKFTGDRVTAVVTAEGDFPLEEYSQLLEDISRVVWAVNSGKSDVSFGEIRKGEGYLTEKLLEITYRIPVFSFFQTNSYQAENLIRQVLNFLLPADRVLDLYCGVGTFSLAIANKVDEVVGIEADATAIEAARENARLNKIENAKFLAKKAEESEISGYDAIVVDPPRAGLHKRVVRALSNSGAKKIVYVSCNPTTQLRDIKMLKNYRLVEIQPIDMFPHTPHIENVALLERS